jgi:phosphatidyl-myo-inositol dimannoside synthase
LKKSQRILFCSTEYPPDTGGLGTYIYEMARGLHELGWEVEVVTLQQFTSEDQINSFNAQQPYKIHRLQHKNDVKTIRHAVTHFRPDFVIATDLPCTWHCWRVCVQKNIPLIAIGMGSEFRQSPYLRRLLKQLVYNTCFHIVPISHYTAALMRKIGIAPRGQTIIYPGGDANLNRPNVDSDFLRERYNLSAKKVLLTMGTLSPRKGQDVVLKALPTILQKHPDVNYVMVGRDRTEGQFARLAHELDVEKAVTFTGMIPDREKAAFYNLAEVCLITSRNTPGDVEGYGIVVIEAALCGRTTIGTYGTGVEETMIQGETGILIPQNTPTDTAAAVIRLLDDDALRRKLEVLAHQRALKECTWETRVQEFDSLLRRLSSTNFSSNHTMIK